MAEVSDAFGPPFQVPLDDGKVLEYAGRVVPDGYDGKPVPELVMRVPVAFGHWLAHYLGSLPFESGRHQDLVQGLEMVSAALRNEAAMQCAANQAGGIGGGQRTAAVTALLELAPQLNGAQRIAVVDSAARWLETDPTGELARALLSAVCGPGPVTDEVYLALLMPPGGAELPGQSGRSGE